MNTMPAPRDVVLVTVDSLRADHCGFMGYDRDVTPVLDDVAASGTVFEHAIAPAPETSGSVGSMLTGQYGNPALVSDGVDYRERTRTHMAARWTLAERFRDRGYETAAFTANPWTSRYFGFEEGFDHFEDFMDESLSSEFVREGRLGRGTVGTLYSLVTNWMQGQDMFMDWEVVADAFFSWLESVESPFFCWIFLVDVHMPYLPPAAYRSRSSLTTTMANASLYAGQMNVPGTSLAHGALIDAYDDTIRYTDAFVGDLVDALDDAVLVVTADHGEGFGERGLYGHGPQIAESALHVPLVVHNGPAGRIERPFSLLRLPELLTTLADDDPIESLAEPTVWARNYDPAIAIRGRNFRYEWRPEAGRVWIADDGDWVETDAPELERLADRLRVYHVETERERARVMEAADAVSEMDVAL